MLRRSVHAHHDLPALLERRRELQAAAATFDARLATLDAEAERVRALGEQAAEPVADVTTARAGLLARIAAGFRLRAEPPDLAGEQRALERREADARRAALQVEGAGAALAEIDRERDEIRRDAAPVARELQQLETAIAFAETMAARARWLEAMRAAAVQHWSLLRLPIH